MQPLDHNMAGKKILLFMRSAPRLKAVIAKFLQFIPPKKDACIALGRRLEHLCGAWRKDVPERLHHAVLDDAFLVQQVMDDDGSGAVSKVASAAKAFTDVLRDAHAKLSSRGHVLAMADLRTAIDAALRNYLWEHTAYSLRREAALVRRLGKRRANEDCRAETDEKRARMEAELERCYGSEMLAWVSRIASSADDTRNVAGRARVWHAALLDRGFEMVYCDAATQDVLLRRGSQASPIKVSFAALLQLWVVLQLIFGAKFHNLLAGRVTVSSSSSPPQAQAKKL
jgi:hypothetical protein